MKRSCNSCNWLPRHLPLEDRLLRDDVPGPSHRRSDRRRPPSAAPFLPARGVRCLALERSAAAAGAAPRFGGGARAEHRRVRSLGWFGSIY